MLERLKQMLIKEFLQTLRDPQMRRIVFVAPVMQMLVIAFAMTTDIRNAALGVLDFQPTVSSRELVEAFTGSGYFYVDRWVKNQAEAQTLLDAGRVRAVLVFPSDFEQALRAGRTAKVQMLADGTDSTDASMLFSYAGGIVRQYARTHQAKNVQLTSSPRSQPVEVQTRAWFNPNLESKFYYVPGMIAIMLMLVSIMLASIAIVREKEIGTIEQVMVTPIRPLEFILGKTLPYLAIGYIIMVLMFIVAFLVFGIWVEGNLLLLTFLAGIYMVGNLGIALCISTISKTQQEALLTAFFILTPGVLLSGLLFPIHNMPLPVQCLTLLDPMRWFLEIMHGVVTKGVGVACLWPSILGQTVLAVLFLLIAASRFKKTSA